MAITNTPTYTTYVFVIVLVLVVYPTLTYVLHALPLYFEVS